MKNIFISNVYIAVEADTLKEATDATSAILTEGLTELTVDWCYRKNLSGYVNPVSVGKYQKGEYGEGVVLEQVCAKHNMHYNAIEVRSLPPTHTLPYRTKLISKRFNQSIIVSNSNPKFDNCKTVIDIAITVLNEKGFEIEGYVEDKLLLTSTFKPLK